MSFFTSNCLASPPPHPNITSNLFKLINTQFIFMLALYSFSQSCPFEGLIWIDKLFVVCFMNPINILVDFTNFIIWYVLLFKGPLFQHPSSWGGVLPATKRVLNFKPYLTSSWISSLNLVIYFYGLFLVTFMPFSDLRISD